MEIKRVDLSEFSDGDVTQTIINLMAFDGLKNSLNGMLLSEYLIKTKIPSQSWRATMGTFIGIPWELSELGEEDYKLLQQIYEMLYI